MTRRAALIWLLLGTVAVAVVFLLAPSRSVIALPGGGELRLTAVTHGTINKYPGRWRNRLARFLPDAIAQELRSGGASIATAATNVLFWFERSGGEMPLFTVADFQGVEFAQMSGISTGTGTDSGWVEGVGFSVVPRREKEIHVRVYAKTNSVELGHLLGEFRVPNPLWGIYPSWTPEPLPATHETNGLTITLRELKAGVRWDGPSEPTPAGHPVESGVLAVFDLAESGAPTDAWMVVGIEASDATGNQFQYRERMSDLRNIKNGRHTLKYRWRLWPSEPAWKLKVQMARRVGFAAHELWTVREFTLSRTGANGGVAAQTNLQGAVVQLEGNILKNPAFGRKTLQVRVDPPREDYRLDLVRVTDDTGRSVARTGESGSVGRHTFDLKPEADAKSLNLTFALHQSIYVEFVVKPELLQRTNVMTTSFSTINSQKELR